MRLSTFCAQACLAAVFAACQAPGDEVTDDLPGELTVGLAQEDGTGFVVVADGASVELEPGSQAGFHVGLGLEIYGVEGALYIEREARRVEDGLLVLRALPQRIDVPSDAMNAPWPKDEAVFAFMCPSPIGVQVWDAEIRFSVKITDGEDTVLAEDALVLVPECPSGDEEEFCYRICSG